MTSTVAKNNNSASSVPSSTLVISAPTISPSPMSAFSPFITVPLCPMCNGFFFQPFMLNCGHSICSVCYENAMIKNISTVDCVKCKKQTRAFTAVQNHTLKDIIRGSQKRKYDEVEEETKKDREYRKNLLELLKYTSQKFITVKCYENGGIISDPNLVLKLIHILEENKDKNILHESVKLLVKDNFIYFGHSVGDLFVSGVKLVIETMHYGFILIK